MTWPSRLIPRRVLFRDPDCSAITLSHDGRRIAWLRECAGSLSLLVAPVSNPSGAKEVIAERVGSIAPVLIWARTGRHVIFFRDQDGDENYRAFSVDTETGTQVALTPGDG